MISGTIGSNIRKLIVVQMRIIKKNYIDDYKHGNVQYYSSDGVYRSTLVFLITYELEVVCGIACCVICCSGNPTLIVGLFPLSRAEEVGHFHLLFQSCLFVGIKVSVC